MLSMNVLPPSLGLTMEPLLLQLVVVEELLFSLLKITVIMQYLQLLPSVLLMLKVLLSFPLLKIKLLNVISTETLIN